MKKCNHCGTELNDDSLLCEVCGQNLEEPEIPSTSEAVESEDTLMEEPVQEAAVSHEPSIFEEADEARPFVSDSITDSVKAELAEAMAKAKKKKRRNRLFSALIVLIIAISAVCILFFTSPKYKLLSAYNNTRSDLDNVVLSCDNFINAVQAANALTTSGQYSMDIGMSAVVYPYYYGVVTYDEYNSDTSGCISAKSKIDYDLEHKLLSSIADYTVTYGDSEASFAVELSADEEQTMFRIPTLLNGTYCFKNESFGKDFTDSLLFEELNLIGIIRSQLREIKLEPFAVNNSSETNAEISKALRTFLNTVEVKKSSVKLVDFDGDVYRIYFEGKDLKVLVKECLLIASNGNKDITRQYEVRQMLKTIREADYKVYAGIEDGKLAAISIQVNNGSKITVVLKGNDNLWDYFTVYSDRSEIMYGGICAADDGMEFELKSRQINAAVLLNVDDNAGEASLTVSAMRMKAKLLTLNYSTDKDNVSLSLGIDPELLIVSSFDDIKIDVTLSPLANTPEMLADEAVEIFTMSESEFEVFVNEFAESIANNPEFSKLLDSGAEQNG